MSCSRRTGRFCSPPLTASPIGCGEAPRAQRAPARRVGLGIGLLVPRLTLTEGAKRIARSFRSWRRTRALLGECHAAVAPRFGISRSVYPAADAATARAHLRAGVERQVQTMVRSGRLPSGLTEDEAFERLNLYFGHPEQVAAALRADQALPHATDLLVQIDPGRVFACPGPDRSGASRQRGGASPRLVAFGLTQVSARRWTMGVKSSIAELGITA